MMKSFVVWKLLQNHWEGKGLVTFHLHQFTEIKTPPQQNKIQRFLRSSNISVLIEKFAFSSLIEDLFWHFHFWLWFGWRKSRVGSFILNWILKNSTSTSQQSMNDVKQLLLVNADDDGNNKLKRTKLTNSFIDNPANFLILNSNLNKNGLREFSTFVAEKHSRQLFDSIKNWLWANWLLFYQLLEEHENFHEKSKRRLPLSFSLLIYL